MTIRRSGRMRGARVLLPGALALVLSVIGNVAAADGAAVISQAEPTLVLQLWPGPAPGSESSQLVEKITTGPGGMARNVTVPTLTVYLPKKEQAVGTGVVIAPGGAFRFVSMEAEGFEMARWFVERGIAAFVLKYRVIETPESDQQMMAELIELLRGGRPANFDEDAKLAIADGMQAMKLVRTWASEWGVSPDRIGFMGFSAGAMIASHVMLRGSEQDRPAFAAPIYGAPFGEIPSIAPSTPPVFLAYASDDTLVAGSVQAFYKALTDAGQHPELHVYRSGGHGFGLRKQGKSSDQWIDNFQHWLESLGLTLRR